MHLFICFLPGSVFPCVCLFVGVFFTAGRVSREEGGKQREVFRKGYLFAVCVCVCVWKGRINFVSQVEKKQNNIVVDEM